jgi:hypothetical protein
MDPAAFLELKKIGLVFDEVSLQSEINSWTAQLEKSKNELSQQSWTVIRTIYNPASSSAVRHWIAHNRHLYSRGDTLVANRLNGHNDLLCKSLHLEFSKVLCPLFPEPVKRSYCYLGIYHDRAVLPKHVDRKQCRWNVSVVLDSSPEITNSEQSWPIYLERVPHKPIAIHAIIGDAIIYRGNKIPHWRDPLPTRFSQVSICFFHYVHKDFVGSLD